MNDFNTELTGATNLKAPMKDSGAKDVREGLWMVPFDKLVILPDFNVREHDAAWQARVEEYAADMEEVGWRKSKPAEVFVDAENRIIIVDAHTRYAAAALARSRGATTLELIPTIPLEKGTSMEDLTIGLVKNNNGEKLSPLGMSIVVKRMVMNHRKTPAETAKLLGISPKYANQMLTLAGAPDSIRQMIMDGKLSATHAIEMLEQHGNDAVRMLEEGMKEAQSKGKTKVRKKNTLTAEDRLEKAQKKHAGTLYQLVDLLIDEKTSEDNKKEVLKKLENVMVAIDQEADGEGEEE